MLRGLVGLCYIQSYTAQAKKQATGEHDPPQFLISPPKQQKGKKYSNQSKWNIYLAGNFREDNAYHPR
jgi:hypothetical protein